MEKKKKIWIIGHYTMPPEYEVRIKTLMWAKYLIQAGYDVTLISASTLHNTDINLISGKEPYVFKQYDEYKFIHIRCNTYRGHGYRRVKNLFEFVNKFKKYAKQFGELPDVILAADIHCVNYKPIGKFAKKNDIKFIVDIRDLWPESIIEYLGFSKKNPVIKYLYHQERNMYKIADAIVFSMEGGKQYIIDKGWDKENGGSIDTNKVHYINNGIVLDDFEYNKNHYQIDDPDLNNPDTFKVIYTGSIRKANNLERIIELAEDLDDKYTKIIFIIYGEGDKRINLEKYCNEKNILNVKFKGSINKKYIPYILSKSNLNLLNYEYHDIWKYGGSQNKLFEYLASGRPVLSTIKMGYDIIENNKAGSSLEENSTEKLKNKIIDFYKMPKKEYQLMCQNALKAAKCYDFQNLTKILIEIIEK